VSWFARAVATAIRASGKGASARKRTANTASNSPFICTLICWLFVVVVAGAEGCTVTVQPRFVGVSLPGPCLSQTTGFSSVARAVPGTDVVVTGARMGSGSVRDPCRLVRQVKQFGG
jgi:hypothetical protein